MMGYDSMGMKTIRKGLRRVNSQLSTGRKGEVSVLMYYCLPPTQGQIMVHLGAVDYLLLPEHFWIAKLGTDSVYVGNTA